MVNVINTGAMPQTVSGYGLQCRCRPEAFNLTNHPDLGYVDPNLMDELFRPGRVIAEPELRVTLFSL